MLNIVGLLISLSFVLGCGGYGIFLLRKSLALISDGQKTIGRVVDIIFVRDGGDWPDYKKYIINYWLVDAVGTKQKEIQQEHFSGTLYQYKKEQHVTIFYDKNNPAEFIVDDKSWMVYPILCLLLGLLFLVVLGYILQFYCQNNFYLPYF